MVQTRGVHGDGILVSSPPVPAESSIHPHHPRIFFVSEPKAVIMKVTAVAIVLVTTVHITAVAYVDYLMNLV